MYFIRAAPLLHPLSSSLSSGIHLFSDLEGDRSLTPGSSEGGSPSCTVNFSRKRTLLKQRTQTWKGQKVCAREKAARRSYSAGKN